MLSLRSRTRQLVAARALAITVSDTTRPSVGPESAHANAMSFYHNHVLEPYVRRPSNKLALKALLQFGEGMTERKLLQAANYVRVELPTRIAHRIDNMQKLPFVVGTDANIMSVYQTHWQSFERLRKLPEIRSLADNAAFCGVLSEILEAHRSVAPKLALGMRKSRSYMPQARINDFMDKMFRSHISRGLLALQQLELSKTPVQGLVGVIAPSIRATTLVTRCATRARQVCIDTYGLAPRIVIDGHRHAELAGVPVHIEHVIFELLKNSMRATVQTHARELLERRAQVTSGSASFADVVRYSDVGAAAMGDALPPVTVCLAQSDRDIVFRVSDEGSGMPSEVVDKVWEYFFTVGPSAPDVHVRVASADEYEYEPMAGLGCGLPLARVYAEYFGGRMELHALDGYGCDAYYFAKRTADDQMESII